MHGKQAYLEPISGSMQKPIEGYRYWHFSGYKMNGAGSSSGNYQYSNVYFARKRNVYIG
jgi:hypothetical protein